MGFWEWLAAGLSGEQRDEPEREPQFITFGPCCGPSDRELEAGG